MTHIYDKMIINNLIQAKETNEDWNNCLDENSLVMGRCVYACNGDRNCMSDCNDDFLERQFDCPCEVNVIENDAILSSLILRKIVLVVVHVQIILVLKRLHLQMLRLPLNQIQPHHQQPMPS